MKGTESEKIWLIEAESLTGRMHQERHMLCQDRYSYGNKGPVYAAVLADGIGRTDFNVYGVQMIVDSIRDELLNGFEELFSMSKDSIRTRIFKVIYASMNDCMVKLGLKMDEFASTILCAAYDEEEGRLLSLHLGDGVILKYGVEDVHISYPENGLLKNQTWVTTSTGSMEHLRVNKYHERGIRKIILMTDGMDIDYNCIRDDYSTEETGDDCTVVKMICRKNGGI